MDLNYLLREVSLDPAKTLVLRHRPKEHELRRVLPWLAVEKPEVFNAYQQTQGPKVEEQMKKAPYIASFIGHEPGLALFVGIYKRCGNEISKKADRKQIPAFCELAKYGHKDSGRKVLWFDLKLTKHLVDWSGKLIVNWPSPEIVWSRWSSKNRFNVFAILEESLMAREMPDWRQLVLTWDELQIIPKKKMASQFG